MRFAQPSRLTPMTTEFPVAIGRFRSPACVPPHSPFVVEAQPVLANGAQAGALLFARNEIEYRIGTQAWAGVLIRIRSQGGPEAEGGDAAVTLPLPFARAFCDAVETAITEITKGTAPRITAP